MARHIQGMTGPSLTDDDNFSCAAQKLPESDAHESILRDQKNADLRREDGLPDNFIRFD